jgi:hypothetical protein
MTIKEVNEINGNRNMKTMKRETTKERRRKR